jgi:hypothetical protein
MERLDPESAAQDLAEVDQRVRRGAEFVLPRSRWWYLGVWLTFAMWGASWDLPGRWRALGLFAFAAVILMINSLSRARPLPMRSGWRFHLLVVAVCGAMIAFTLALGIALQAAGLPMPFTVSGFLLGIAASLLVRPVLRWRGSYVERVSGGQW